MGRRRRKLRFARIRRSLANRLGVSVQETQSGYNYPEIPEQVAQGIPNYYADSRKVRMLGPMPQEAGDKARSIGRFIFESLPDDPDRGKDVESTIANVLDYAANRATAANDQQNAAFLAKIAERWRKVIGKATAAIDPDAPIGETSGFGAILPTDPKSKKLIVAAFLAAGFYGYQKGGKKGEGKRLFGYGLSGAIAALLLSRVIEQVE